jgi:hypothetical protein
MQLICKARWIALSIYKAAGRQQVEMNPFVLIQGDGEALYE